MSAVPLRAVEFCYSCRRPLADAEVLNTTHRLIRSGPHIGRRGQWRRLRCGCGRVLKVLWALTQEPGRAA